MPSLRLIADDLTGALDTAARFTGFVGPIDVAWVGAPETVGNNFALDTGTRERDAADATQIVAAVVPRLHSAEITFKKVDSLLRGPWAAELAVCFGTAAWRHVVVAPAFPYQGRRTVGGYQSIRTEEGWQVASGNIAESLRAAGLLTRSARVEDDLLDGVAVYDATDDADLDRIASFAARAAGPILWCGSGGLAGALARRSPAPCDTRLVGPVLGLFGSDRPETEAQLAHCPEHRLIVPAEGDHVRLVATRLRERDAALVSIGLPKGTSRKGAAACIATSFGALARALPPPGTLLVAGGETLKALCLALGTEALVVTAEVAPGLPRSRMRGGLWDGVAVVSKSGAFGSPNIWRDLLRHNGLLTERTSA